jgi:hypothetical protein
LALPLQVSDSSQETWAQLDRFRLPTLAKPPSIIPFTLRHRV